MKIGTKMTLELYLAYVAATLIVLAIPGPTIMLVVSYALTQGRKSAAASVMGVGLGDATAAAASLLGLGALLAASATAFTVLKWVGAAYLVWLGLKMWRSRPSALGPHTVADIPAGKIFWHAYVVTALNPKGIVFFMAFLPHFIAPQAPVVPQLFLLGITFVVLGIVNAAVYAFAAAAVGQKLRSPSLLRLINRVGGGFLISAAAMTATLQRSSS
ncbi:Homoserine/homoserine lactone efflux protein [Roseibium alexandrii]|jgi:homoserine/homoserine lactone efflux protein|uniref:Homoserine/homoserine lactone efflux protein n=3 Tax=Hyphomicrobiales TaxID=356 RepID=A0A0M7A6A9_9HYPH|nr:putative threonine efflux protein [Roseibium alexandrii DFL-11]CTQ70675.1 Homoserine/homoserine lactone efflux protein [Roseibium alexandrii]